MGVRRTSTALYTNQSPESPIVMEFADFLVQDIGKGFSILPCSEVKDFGNPRISRGALRANDT
jgi:hypothetical protein